jgi:hypothetical protein
MSIWSDRKGNVILVHGRSLPGTDPGFCIQGADLADVAQALDEEVALRRPPPIPN